MEESRTIELEVSMACGGCSGAVNKALEKVAGVASVDIDMKNQKVTVKGNVEPGAVLAAVQKTGKKAAFWKPKATVSQNGGADSVVDEPNEPVALKA